MLATSEDETTKQEVTMVVYLALVLVCLLVLAICLYAYFQRDIDRIVQKQEKTRSLIKAIQLHDLAQKQAKHEQFVFRRQCDECVNRAVPGGCPSHCQAHVPRAATCSMRLILLVVFTASVLIGQGAISESVDQDQVVARVALAGTLSIEKGSEFHLQSDSALHGRILTDTAQETQSVAAIVVASLCAVLTLVLGAAGGLLPYWLAGEPVLSTQCCGFTKTNVGGRSAHDSPRGTFSQLDGPQVSASAGAGSAAPIVDPAWISLANCFAGGVLLSAGYAHFMPDVVRAATLLGIEEQPLPFLFPLLGLLLPFALDGMTECGPEVQVGGGEEGAGVEARRMREGSIGAMGGLQEAGQGGGKGGRFLEADNGAVEGGRGREGGNGVERDFAAVGAAVVEMGSSTGVAGSGDEEARGEGRGEAEADSAGGREGVIVLSGSSGSDSEAETGQDVGGRGSHRQLQAAFDLAKGGAGREAGHLVPPSPGHLVPPSPGHQQEHQGHSHGAAAAALATGQGGLGTALVLVLSLSVHSLLEGVGIGVQTEVAAAVAIGMAVSAHKGFAAFAMGTSLRANGVGYAAAARLVLVFAAMTPLGIALGIVLKAGLQSPWVDLVSTGLAQGTFVYVAVVEILREELHVDVGGGGAERGNPKAKWAALSVGIALFVVLGYALPSD